MLQVINSQWWSCKRMVEGVRREQVSEVQEV